MKTKDKKRIARKMFTVDDRLAGKSIFTSKAWLQRKSFKLIKVINGLIIQAKRKQGVK